MSKKDVYTVDDVASILKVSTKTVYTLVHEQQLRCIRVRGQIRITSEQLDNYLRGGITSGEEVESYTLPEERSLLR